MYQPRIPLDNIEQDMLTRWRKVRQSRDGLAKFAKKQYNKRLRNKYKNIKEIDNES